MKLKVPKEVRWAIKDVDMAKFGQLKREVNARAAEKKRLAAIQALRDSRGPALLDAAKEIFDWRAAYLLTEEAKRISEIAAERPVVLFGARFWKGEPTDDRHCWAVLSVAAEGTLCYEERYNSPMGSHAANRTLIADPSALVAAVHPDFLEKCRQHLGGADAWKYILQELERMAKAYR
jgi:hypothetical protein